MMPSVIADCPDLVPPIFWTSLRKCELAYFHFKFHNILISWPVGLETRGFVVTFTDELIDFYFDLLLSCRRKIIFSST